MKKHLLQYSSTDKRINEGYPVELEFLINGQNIIIKKLFYINEESVVEARSLNSSAEILEVYKEEELSGWLRSLDELAMMQMRSLMRSDSKMPYYVKQAIVARNVCVQR
jgi:hypothetical protein